MRKIGLAVSTLLVLGGTAFAADLPFRPAPAFMPAPAPTWTGFYVGLNGGGGIGTGNSDFSIAGGPTFASIDNSVSGAIGGGQLGYNWQTGPVVFGVETDFQGSTVKGTVTAPCFPALCGLPLSASYSQELSWFGTARGRIGYASAGWLLYATAGYAYGQVKTNASASAGAATVGLGMTENRNGWTAGGGIEVEFAPRWTAKVEYLFVDLGQVNHSFVFPAVATINDTTRMTVNVARAGVNFRF
jgi:outer membrane immunogenic protein